jgi:H-type small acid-soluble spore protein
MRNLAEILNSKGAINVTYNGMPVWLESMHGEDAEVTFIGMNQKSSVPISALAETEPLHGI